MCCRVLLLNKLGWSSKVYLHNLPCTQGVRVRSLSGTALLPCHHVLVGALYNWHGTTAWTSAQDGGVRLTDSSF